MAAHRSSKHSARNRIPTPKVKRFPEVHSQGHLKDCDSEKMAPTFSFYHLDTREECPSAWNKEEIRSLYSTLKTASSTPWSNVRSISGLRYKAVDTARCKRVLPLNLSEDISLSEFRISRKARVFGVRVKHIFYIIWFDRNHQVLPE